MSTPWEAIRRGIAAACAAPLEDDLAGIVRTLELASADMDAFLTLHALGAEEQRAFVCLRAQAVSWEREKARALFDSLHAAPVVVSNARERESGRRASSSRPLKTIHVEPVTALDVVSDPTPGLVLVYSRLHQHLPAAVPLALPLVTLGRECENTLAIPESSVSRQHARVERRADGRVWVVDTGSLNGTFINGRRVHEQALVPHDLLRLGDTMFRFVEGGIYGYGAYRVDGSVVKQARPFTHGIAQPALVGGYQVDALLDRVDKVARSKVSVLVHGEIGTGKHVLARELHRVSGRTGPLVGLNCAALPEAQIDSELFGWAARTPGEPDKPGLFRAAEGGTLFLDEVSELPLGVQDKLLRVLCDQSLPRLRADDQPARGASDESPAVDRVDVRLVCATHVDLLARVAAGTFRGALLSRLRELSLALPPLRERREDLYPLLQHFLAQHGHPAQAISFAFVFALVHYPWPYNVGELESAIRVAVRLADGATLDLQHLPEGVRAAIEHSGATPADPSSAGSGLASQMCETAPAASLNATEMAGCVVGFWPLRGHAAANDGSPRKSGLRAAREREREADAPRDVAEPGARSDLPSEPTLRALLGDHAGDTEALALALNTRHERVLSWLRHYELDARDFRN